jgi:prepilin-type N-terminal cleavage/methylation domain-containing protein
MIGSNLPSPAAACLSVVRDRRRAGMTLVEMLVAMAITLVMMGVVAQIFGMMGQGVNASRSMAELNDRMRATAYRLKQDLSGITVDVKPPVRPEVNSGYFEVIEGPDSDLVSYAPVATGGEPFRKDGLAEPYQTAIGSDDRVVGDCDDIILFTTRSTGESFVGKADTRNAGLEGGGFRSPFAEVIWFCRPTANTFNPRTYTLHRRQRLITAHPGAEPFVISTKPVPSTNVDGGPPNTLPFTTWAELHGRTDVSCRRQGSLAIPNTLGDLTSRENRFLHSESFPHIFDSSSSDLTFGPTSPRFGEDVIMTNIIAFDVRVWDAEARVQVVPKGSLATDVGVAVQPGDSGYDSSANPANPGQRIGAYVNLGYLASDVDGIPSGVFASDVLAGRGRSGWSALDFDDKGPRWHYFPRTYCTWSGRYSTLGIAQAPPYQTRIEAVEIRIRCYEPSSRQIRQITVRHHFE